MKLSSTHDVRIVTIRLDDEADAIVMQRRKLLLNRLRVASISETIRTIIKESVKA